MLYFRHVMSTETDSKSEIVKWIPRWFNYSITYTITQSACFPPIDGSDGWWDPQPHTAERSFWSAERSNADAVWRDFKQELEAITSGACTPCKFGCDNSRNKWSVGAIKRDSCGFSQDDSFLTWQPPKIRCQWHSGGLPLCIKYEG